MPQLREPATQPSVWSILQRLLQEGGLNNYLNKGIFPATMHEPGSDLMRQAETVFATQLLNEAAKEEAGSLKRLLLVTAFNIAQWAEVFERLKFFAAPPAVLETFEYVHPETSCRILVEHVEADNAKHMGTTVWKIWGKQWGVEGQIQPTQKFSISSGPGIDYSTHNRSEIIFADGESYFCDLPGGRITGLTATEQTFSFKGNATVTNPSSGLASKVNMTEPGILSRDPKHSVKGTFTKDGKRVEGVSLEGTWNNRLSAIWAGKTPNDAIEMVLWQKPIEDRSNNVFGFTKERMQLNCMDGRLQSVLPPTDTRLRADVQLLEQGHFSKVEPIMKEICAAHTTKHGGSQPRPSWFQANPPDSWLLYKYKGGYWEARLARAQGSRSAWATCPDLFSLGKPYDQELASEMRQLSL